METSLNSNIDTMNAQELKNLIIDFSKYDGDIEAIEFVNECLGELKYKLRVSEYKVFTEYLNREFPLFYS